MKTMIRKPALGAALITSFLAAHAAAQEGANQYNGVTEPATQFQTSKPPAQNYEENYAEELYRDVERFSKGAVSFRLRTVAVGRLTEISTKKASDLIAPSAHTLAYTEGRVELTEVHFLSAEAGALDSDFNQYFNEYAVGGLPLELGIYRKLELTTQLGEQSRTHEALELCWPSQIYCTVIDAAQVNLDNTVREIRRLRAEGPAYTLVPDESAEQSKTVSCSLLHNDDNPYKKIMAPYYKTGRNGARANWQIWVGHAEGKLHCRSHEGRCQMFSTVRADGSRVEAPGRTAQCDTGSINPDTETTGKYEFSTGCAIGSPGKQVKFDVRVEGAGMSADIVTEAIDASVIHKNASYAQDHCLEDRR